MLSSLFAQERIAALRLLGFDIINLGSDEPIRLVAANTGGVCST
jgi:hypothetical protein